MYEFQGIFNFDIDDNLCKSSCKNLKYLHFEQNPRTQFLHKTWVHSRIGIQKRQGFRSAVTFNWT